MEKIYTVKEAATILGFSTNTLYKYLENGAIEAARGVGKQARFRIPHSAIETYLKTTLTEDQVLKVLNPSEYAKRQLPPPTQISLKSTSIHPSFSHTQLPVQIARILIIGALIFMILDLLVTPTFSLSTTLFRMGMIAIFVLLAYQFGGYQKFK